MKMNKNRMLLVIAVLGLAALACNFGGGDDAASPPDTGQVEDSSGDDASSSDDQGDTQEGDPVVSDGAETGDDASSDTGDDASSEDDTSTVEDSSTEGGDSSETDDGTSPVSGGPDMIDLDDPLLYDQPDDIETYHVSLLNTFDAMDGSTPVNGTVDMIGQSRIDPFETTLEFFTDGDAVFGGGEVFTFTQIIEEQYIVSPSLPQCMSSIPGLQQNPFEILLDAGGLLTGEAQRLPDQVINGLDTYVYEITNDNVDELDGAGADVQEITNGWVAFAQEGFYVVQLHIEGIGVNTLLSQNETLVGDIFYELNYFDFNTPVDIQIPFGCGDLGEENTDYPTPDDASGFSSFGGVVTFTSMMSVEDLVDFYNTEMPALGCGSPDEIISPVGSIITYPDCPAGSVQVGIVPDGSGGNLVSIIELP